MVQSWLFPVVIVVLAMLSPLAEAATPIPIAVGAIQSIGGEQNFCPSTTLQRAIVKALSSNRTYQVEMLSPAVNQVGVQVTGTANCSLGMRQQQKGFLFFQQQSAITTATVELQLQLVNSSTGTTIATISEQGKAQLEAQTTPGQLLPVESNSEMLFEQAIAQALDTMLPKVNTALTQITL